MDIIDVRQLIINKLFIPNKLLFKSVNKEYNNYLSKDEYIDDYNKYIKQYNKYDIEKMYINGYYKLLEEYIIKNNLEELDRNHLINLIYESEKIDVKMMKLICNKSTDEYTISYTLRRFCRSNINIEVIKYLYN